MSIFKSMNISSSALTAQSIRMDTIAENIANANTTRAADGQPYRRKVVTFAQAESPSFAQHLKNYIDGDGTPGGGVTVKSIETDPSPFKLVYDPDHPDADQDGYVSMPNVDITKEMVDMISATRSYEANVTALNAFKNIAMKALQIGK